MYTNTNRYAWQTVLQEGHFIFPKGAFVGLATPVVPPPEGFVTCPDPKGAWRVSRIDYLDSTGGRAVPEQHRAIVRWERLIEILPYAESERRLKENLKQST